MNTGLTTDNRQPTMRGLVSIFISLLVVGCLSFVSYAQAQSVDILWQGEVYTPPFYQGKSLWGKQSRITLVAIPQGLGTASNLNYKWTKNGTVLGNFNGVGRNTLSFVDTVLSRSQNIKVDILSAQNSVLASASVLVTPQSPTLSVYENSPLYGLMFHKEVGDKFSLKNSEITLTAFPFFVTTPNRDDTNMKYEWSTNVGDKNTGGSVTYRIPENTSGESEILVKNSNSNTITQFSSKKFLIEFGK